MLKREDLILLLQDILPEFKGDLDLTFDQVGIDSFDLLSLRATLGERLNIYFGDDDWVKITKLSEFLKYGKKKVDSFSLDKETNASRLVRQYKLNMPQMATGGMGESWFYKEIGDMHWQQIAKLLQVDSDQILDVFANRLYATFVRIKYVSSHSFCEFLENEEVSLVTNMEKFGAFFLSENMTKSFDKTIQSQLVTSFVSRGSNNKELKKSEPAKTVSFDMKVHSETPDFLKQYHEVRKNEKEVLSLGDYRFQLKNVEPVYSCEYELNPYTDLNGVNLLYFAAYPLIFDLCERKYINEKKMVENDWALATSSVAKDIYYLGNMDINDKIIFNLENFEFKNNYFYSSATMLRKSDLKVVARIFSIKKKVV